MEPENQQDNFDLKIFLRWNLTFHLQREVKGRCHLGAYILPSVIHGHRQSWSCGWESLNSLDLRNGGGGGGAGFGVALYLKISTD